MAGIWNFIPRNVPRMFVAMPRSNSSGSMSASGAGIGPSVALLNAASSRAVRRQGLVDQVAHRLGVGHVGADRERPAAARPRCRCATDSSAAVSRAPRTTAAPGGGERLGGGRADALARAPATRATSPAHRQWSVHDACLLVMAHLDARCLSITISND